MSYTKQHLMDILEMDRWGMSPMEIANSTGERVETIVEVLDRWAPKYPEWDDLPEEELYEEVAFNPPNQ